MSSYILPMSSYSVPDEDSASVADNVWIYDKDAHSVQYSIEEVSVYNENDDMSVLSSDPNTHGM